MSKIRSNAFLKKWSFIILLLFSCFIAAGSSAYAQTQDVSLSTTTTTVSINDPVTVAVDYSTSDSTTTGVGITVCFASAQLQWERFENLFATGLFNQSSASANDTTDIDGNVTTDKFVKLSYVDFAGNWPGSTQQKITDIVFTAIGAGASPINVVIDPESGFTGNPTNIPSLEVVGNPSITSITPNHGIMNGGYDVTIAGTGFQADASTVTFGSTEATAYATRTATQIVCTVPSTSTPGSATVTVTNPGNSATGTTSFTYDTSPVITSIDPTGGSTAGGNQVTITGQYFEDGAATVEFGATAATAYSTRTATQIVCTAPPGAAGQVTVTVTNPTTTLTGTGQYTYYAPPAITAIDPTGGDVAGGDSVTITGTDFEADASTVTFGGTAAASYTSRTATEIICVTPPGSGAVTVEVTNPTSGLKDNIEYTYYVPPSITGITPDRLAYDTGGSLTINGTDFEAGASTVTIGGAAVTTYTTQTATQIVCDVPTPGTPGYADVVVTNPSSGMTDTLSNTFIYQGDPPNITAITPGIGSSAGGTTVTIDGTNFATGATVTFDTSPATITGTTGTTQIVCTAPAHAAATGVTVTVENPDGGQGTTTFEYQDPPTISSISPTFTQTNGTEAVTIAGSNFATDATVTFQFAGGDQQATITSQSATEIIFDAPNQAAAEQNVPVIVTNPASGLTAQTSFSYYAPPVINTITPDFGPIAGGISVTIDGADFEADNVGVKFDTLDATVTSSTASQIVCTAPAHAQGAVDVTVTNKTPNFSTTSTGGFTYWDVPAITDIAPVIGPHAGGTAVTITGTNFLGGTLGTTVDVTFGGNAATVTSVTDTEIQLTTPAATDVTVTDVDVVVTNEGQQSATQTNGFAYVPGPVITAVTPLQGEENTAVDVTITGDNFLSGATVEFGAGNNATGVTFLSETELTCTTPDTLAAGAYDVIVTNPDGTAVTKTSGYTAVTAGSPMITSVSPNIGRENTATSVTISGSGFGAAEGTVTFGAGAATITTWSDTSIECTTPNNVAAGAVDVAVDATTATGAFTFLAAPTVTSVSPAIGTTLGGTKVVVNGTNFVSGATVDFDGTAATSVKFISDTQLTCVTPANATAVAVDVTVTNPDTGAGTGTGVFTYAAPPEITSVTPNSGDPNVETTVTIAGSSFGATQGQVTFGSTAAAAITSWSDTTIECTTPALGSQVVSVTVTTSDNISGSLANAYTYTGGTLTVTLNPSTGPATGGTFVTIGGGPFDAGATVTFAGSPVTAAFVSTSQMTFVTPSTTAGYVTVKVTNTTGVSGSAQFYATSGYQPPATTFYQLTISADPADGGTVSPESGNWYASGVTVDISATAKQGYEFSEWIGDVADKTDSTTTVTLSANKTVTAKFTQIETVELTMAATPENAGTTTPTVSDSPHTVNKGSQQSISADPADGYIFDHWEGAGIADTTARSTKVTMDVSKTVTAVFIDGGAEVTLTLAVSPEGAGTTDPAVGSHVRTTGTQSIAAYAADGWRFANWTGDGIQDKNSSMTDLNLTKDQTVTANFVKLYTLTMKADPANGGSTSPAAGSHTVAAGSQSITALPADGYVFDRWEGTGIASSSSKMTTINMDDNKTATAVFKPGETDSKEFGFVTVTAPSSGSAFLSAQLVGMTEMPDYPGNVKFPYGNLVDLEVSSLEAGQEVEYTFKFNEPLPAGAGWYIYDALNGWYQYPVDYYTISEDRKTVIVKMKDGAYGDSDDTVGQVSMRSGPGVKEVDDSGDDDDGGGGDCFIQSSSDHSRNSGSAGVIGMFAAIAMLAAGFIGRKEK